MSGGEGLWEGGGVPDGSKWKQMEANVTGWWIQCAQR